LLEYQERRAVRVRRTGQIRRIPATIQHAWRAGLDALFREGSRQTFS